MKFFVFVISILISFSIQAQTNRNPAYKTDYKNVENLINNSNYKEALDSLKTFSPDSIYTRYLNAFCLLKLKKSIDAEWIFSDIYRENPSFRNTCLFYAQSIVSQIDLNKKLTEFDMFSFNLANGILTKGIELTSNRISSDILARYLATRGQILQIKGRFEEAISDLTKAIELDPQGDYYTRRAMTYHFMSQNDLACSDFKKGETLGETYNMDFIKTVCH